MILRITDTKAFDYDMLKKNCYGRKILAYLKAYDINYDFCRFYKLDYDEGYGFLLHINSTIVICTENDIPTDELCEFIRMNMPFRVEMSQILLDKLSVIPEYQILRRTMFELTDNGIPENFNEDYVNAQPKLDDAYAILQEGFPNLQEHGLWLTDTSHRIRRGVSKVFTYRECTTASIVYDVDDTVLVGQVATKVSSRGSGYAREFLYWLGHKLKQDGKSAHLFALDIRVSFYREIGFKELLTEFVLERQDIEKETQQKGALR